MSGDIVGTALDGGDCTITLKKSVAATTLGTITITSAATVGTIDEATFDGVAAAHGFDSTDYVTVSVDGHASTTAAILPGVNIYLFFEPDK